MKYPEHFFDRLKMSFSVAFKKPMQYLVFPAVILSVVNLFSLLAGMNVLFVLLSLVAWVVGAIMVYVGVSRAVGHELEGKTDSSFGGVIQGSLSDTGEYILLMLRSTWYLLWPVLAALFFLFIVAVASGSGEMFSALVILDSQGGGELSDEMLMQLMGSLMGVGIIAVIVFLGIFLLMVYRSTKLAFVVPAFAVEKHTWKQAFEKTLKLTEGTWWQTFGNFIGATLAWGIPVGIIAGILSLLFVGMMTSDVALMVEMQEAGQVLPQMGMSVGFIVANFVLTFVASLGTAGLIVFTVIFYGSMKQQKNVSEVKSV